ncbi:MAG TPA: hypothetical protein VEO00_07870 [Actinomycetota bacterium]|nr:hypothetical protein [Actinomycetota bacterium]
MTGFLVGSVEEAAARLTELIADRWLRAALGRAGRDHVRRRFLTLRELEDYLRLVASLR